jgi:hypothetical protein
VEWTIQKKRNRRIAPADIPPSAPGPPGRGLLPDVPVAGELDWLGFVADDLAHHLARLPEQAWDLKLPVFDRVWPVFDLATTPPRSRPATSASSPPMPPRSTTKQAVAAASPVPPGGLRGAGASPWACGR